MYHFNLYIFYVFFFYNLFFFQILLNLLFNLNLLSIIYLKIHTIDIETSIRNEFYSNKFKIDHKNNLKFEVTDNKLLLAGFYFAKYYIPENIVNIIKFNITYSNLIAKLASVIIN